MRLLYILTFLLSVNTVCAQLPAIPAKNSTTENYLYYYRSVAKAEEYIVQGLYQEAVEYYMRIFNTYKYNNPIDCYVAAQVAAYIADTSSCQAIIYKGLSFGLPVATVISNPHLQRLFKTCNRYLIDSCSREYEKSIDAEARAAVLLLAKKDREYTRAHQGELYEKDKHTLKAVHIPFFDSLINDIIYLTGVHGFPSQRIAGTQRGDDSLFRTGPNSLFTLYIFIHRGDGWKRLQPLLWAELQNGNIHPQLYGMIYESTYVKSRYENGVNYFAGRPCQESQCKKLVAEKNIPAIDSLRWEIGLCSYQIMEAKFKSQMQYKKWLTATKRKNAPYFDFECYPGFQGL